MDALDVFRVGAEVGGVVDFVLEELVWGVGLVSEVRGWVWDGGGGGDGGRKGRGKGNVTMPVTLLPMKSAGWFLLSLDNRK